MIKRSVVAVTLLLFLAAGCGGHANSSVPVDSPSSPLGNGGINNTQCGPDPTGGIVTDGSTALANHSKGTVTVEGVRYYGDHGLRLVHAVVLPVQGALVGVGNGWPPARSHLINAKARWSQAVPAVGARIPHHLPRFTQVNLVLGFKPVAHRSVADGIQVRYREGSQQYVLRTHTKTVIVIAEGTTNRECGF